MRGNYYDVEKNYKIKQTNAALKIAKDEIDWFGASIMGAEGSFTSALERNVAEKVATKTIYRAVGEGEFEDILASKMIRPVPRSMEVKLFSETFRDAYSQGLATQQKFRVIKVEIDQNMFNKLFKTTTIDEHITQGRETYGVELDQVQEFNKSIKSVKATNVIP